MSKNRWAVMRWVWVGMPLLAMAWWSAPEWPARAQSMEDPWREPVWRAATSWQAAVRPSSVSPSTALVAPSPEPALVVVESYSDLPPVGEPSETFKESAPVSPTTPPSPDSPMVPGVVLMIGDSLMAEVAMGMRQELPASAGWTIIDASRHSTGLSNLAYFDWPSHAASLVAEHQPVLVIIHLGGNDGQAILHQETSWMKFNSQDWQQVYLARAQLLIEKIQEASPETTVAWVGLPWMRDSGFEGKMAAIDTQQRLASSDIVFVDHRQPDTLYEKDGLDLQGKHQVWRANDGIHYTRAGGRRLAQSVLSHPAIAPLLPPP